MAELAVGVEIAKGSRRKTRQAFLDDVVAGIPILDYDLAAARVHAQLLVAARAGGQPRGAHDLIIAATARATARTIATIDQRGFADLPGVVTRSAG